MPIYYKKHDKPLSAVRVVFIVLCAALALLPLLGMIWAPTNQTSENRELAPFPALIDENGLNFDFLSELGAYFEDHYAYRSMFATASAKLSTQLRVSVNSDVVILGEDGWLYYEGTTDDYLGKGLISTREAENIAFDLSLIRDYCSSCGASFAVAIPPNKNTLYPEHMPYYLGEAAENHSLEAISDALRNVNVSYFDAYERMKPDGEVYYYLRDSHWNTNGARLASEELLRALGDYDAAKRISELTPEWREDYIGDLNAALYPDSAVPEGDAHYEDQLFWTNEEGVTIEDDWIVTKSGARDAKGTLVMFRDSFGNNMIQFLADAFENAYFTRQTPFDITLVEELGATDVILETVERDLDLMATNLAIMPAPSTSLPAEDIDRGAIFGVQAHSEIDVRASDSGEFAIIDGCIPEEYARAGTTEIYVGIGQGDDIQWYMPFRVTLSGDPFGYRAYVSPDKLANAAPISIVVKSDGALKLVQTTS